MLAWFTDSANFGTMIACGTALVATLALCLTIGIGLGSLRRHLTDSHDDLSIEIQKLARFLVTRESTRESVRETTMAQPTTQTSPQPMTQPTSRAEARSSATHTEPAPLTPSPAQSPTGMPASVVAHNRFAALDNDPLNQ